MSRSRTSSAEDVSRSVPHAYQPTDVRRRQIAEAALELIAEVGLDGFTTRAVAARVKITDGAIFRHFERKQDIVLAAMDLLEEQMFAAPPDHNDALERLQAWFSHRAECVASHGAFGHLVFSEQLIHAAGESARAKIRGWQQRNLDLMRTNLESLQQQGRLRPELSVNELLPVLRGMVLVFAFERGIDGPTSPSALDQRITERWSAFCKLVLL